MKLILFLFFISFFSQCKSSESNIKDRSNDSLEIVSFSFDSSFGAEINILGLSTGIYSGESIMGCYYSECFRNSVNESSGTFLIFTSQTLKDDKNFSEEPYLFLRNKGYSIRGLNRDKIPLTYYGRIKVRAGFIFGFSFEFNFLELADFVLGFAGIDFLEDDYNQYIEELIQNRKRRLLK